MKDINWKHIAESLKSYSAETIDGVIPVFAYASEFPVQLKAGIEDDLDLSYYGNEFYTFYVTLIKKGAEYKSSIQAYVQNKNGEIPIFFENKSFALHKKSEIQDYIKMPLLYFNLNGHVRIMTFKNTTMQEQEFKEIIELWRTQPSQTQS